MTGRKRIFILLFIANVVFLSAGISSADSPPVNNNCGFEVIDITSEAGKIFSNRVDSILDQLYGRSPGPLTALIPSLFVIAIFSLFLDYLKGRLELISFMTRIFIVLVLLGYYNANDKWNYLNIIQNTTSTLADSIKYVTQDGQQMDARTAVWNTFYEMYRNIALESVQPSSKGEKVVRWIGNFIGLGGAIDAAHILGFIVSPAGITSIMFILTTLLVALFSYILDAGADILLMILRLVGPIALCFGLIRSTQHIAWGWLQRFIEVCLWKLVYAIFIVGIVTIFERLGQVAFDPSYYQDLDTLTGLQCSFTAMLLSIVVGIVALFMLASIPSICASLVEGRSAGMGTTVSLLLGAAAYGAMSVARRAAASVGTRLRGGGDNGSGGVKDAVDKQRQADRLGRKVDSARQNYHQMQQKAAAGLASPQAMEKAGEKLGTLIGKHNTAQAQAIAAAARITTPMLKQAADNIKSAERMKQDLATLSAAIQKLPDSPLKDQALAALKSMQEAADKAKAFAEQASKHAAATGSAIQGHLEKEAKKSLDQTAAATAASNAMLKTARDEGSKFAGLANELGLKLSSGGQNPNSLIQHAIDKQNIAASKQREAMGSKQELQRVQDLASQGKASPTDVKDAAQKYGDALAEARAARRDAVASISAVTKPVSQEAKENLKAASQMEKNAAMLQNAFAKSPDSAMKQEAQKALANTQNAAEAAKNEANEVRRNTAAAASAIKSGDAQKAHDYMKAARESLTTSRESLKEGAMHAQKADAIARAMGIKPDSDGPSGGKGGPKGSGPSGSGGTPSNSWGPKNSGSGGSNGSGGASSNGSGGSGGMTSSGPPQQSSFKTGTVGPAARTKGSYGTNGNVTGSNNRSSSGSPTNGSLSGDRKNKMAALNTQSSSANPPLGVVSSKSEKSTERSQVQGKVQSDSSSGKHASISSKSEKVSDPLSSHAPKANETSKGSGYKPDSAQPSHVTSVRKGTGPNGSSGTASSFSPKNSGSRDSRGSNGKGGSPDNPGSNGGMIRSPGVPKLSNLQTGQTAINPPVGSASKSTVSTGPDGGSSGNGNAPTGGGYLQRKNESRVSLTKDATSSQNPSFGSASSTGSRSPGSNSANSRSYRPDNSKAKPGAFESTAIYNNMSSRGPRMNESSAKLQTGKPLQTISGPKELAENVGIKGHQSRTIIQSLSSPDSRTGNNQASGRLSVSNNSDSKSPKYEGRVVFGDREQDRNRSGSHEPKISVATSFNNEAADHWVRSASQKQVEALERDLNRIQASPVTNYPEVRIDYNLNSSKDPLSESSGLRAAAEKRFSERFGGIIKDWQFDTDNGQLVGHGFRKVDPQELNLNHPAEKYFVNGLKAIKPEPQLQIIADQGTPVRADQNRTGNETAFRPDEGVHTSTFDERKHSSDWVEWARKEKPDVLSDDWQILIPTESTRVLRIDSSEDATRLLAHPKYSMDAADGNGRVPNFKAIAQDFDGFSVGQEVASDKDSRFSSYHAESTIWFNQAFEKQYSIKPNDTELPEEKHFSHGNNTEESPKQSDSPPKQSDLEHDTGLRRSVEKVINKLLSKKGRQDAE